MAASDEDEECDEGMDKADKLESDEVIFLIIQGLRDSLTEDASYEDQVQAVLSSWQRMSTVRETTPSSHTVQFIQLLFRRSVQVVLSPGWSQLVTRRPPVVEGDGADVVADLRRALDLFMQTPAATSVSTATASPAPPCADDAVTAMCHQLHQLLVADDLWSQPPQLQQLMDRQPLSPQQVMDLCCGEGPLLLTLRLQALCELRRENHALALVQQCVSCMDMADDVTFRDRCSESDRHFFTDLHLSLLFKCKQKDEVVTRLHAMDECAGVALVRRFASRLDCKQRCWRNGRRMAPFVSQVLLMESLKRPHATLVRGMAAEWVCLVKGEYADLTELESLIRKLTSNTETASHLVDFSSAVFDQLGTAARPLAIELCVLALTRLTNQLQRTQAAAAGGSEDSSFAAASQQCRRQLASGFLRLAELTAAAPRVSRECVLSAFSLQPTDAALEQLTALAGPEAEAVGRPRTRAVSDDSGCSEDEQFAACTDALISQLRGDDVAGEADAKPPLKDRHLLDVLIKANRDSGSDYDVLGADCMATVSELHVPDHMASDLMVVLSASRWKLLSWTRPWTDLQSMCHAYRRDPDALRNITKELKFLEIDYSQFGPVKKEEVDYYYGIEKGYERFLDMSSDDETEKIVASVRERRQSMSSPNSASSSSNSSDVDYGARRKSKSTGRRAKKRTGSVDSGVKLKTGSVKRSVGRSRSAATASPGTMIKSKKVPKPSFIASPVLGGVKAEFNEDDDSACSPSEARVEGKRVISTTASALAKRAGSATTMVRHKGRPRKHALVPPSVHLPPSAWSEKLNLLRHLMEERQRNFQQQLQTGNYQLPDAPQQLPDATQKSVVAVSQPHQLAPVVYSRQQQHQNIAQQLRQVRPVAQQLRQVRPVAQLLRQVRPVAQQLRQVRPFAQQVRPTAKQLRQLRPMAQQLRPAAQQLRQVRPFAQQVRPAAQQVRPAAQQVRPAAQQLRQVRPFTQQVPQVRCSVPTSITASVNAAAARLGVPSAHAALFSPRAQQPPRPAFQAEPRPAHYHTPTIFQPTVRLESNPLLGLHDPLSTPPPAHSQQSADKLAWRPPGPTAAASDIATDLRLSASPAQTSSSRTMPVSTPTSRPARPQLHNSVSRTVSPGSKPKSGNKRSQSLPTTAGRKKNRFRNLYTKDSIMSWNSLMLQAQHKLETQHKLEAQHKLLVQQNSHVLSHLPKCISVVPVQEHLVYPVHQTHSQQQRRPRAGRSTSSLLPSAAVSVRAASAATGVGSLVTTAAPVSAQAGGSVSMVARSRTPSAAGNRNKKVRTTASTTTPQSAAASNDAQGSSAGVSLEGASGVGGRSTVRTSISVQEVLRRVQEESNANRAARVSASSSLLRLGGTAGSLMTSVGTPPSVVPSRIFSHMAQQQQSSPDSSSRSAAVSVVSSVSTSGASGLGLSELLQSNDARHAVFNSDSPVSTAYTSLSQLLNSTPEPRVMSAGAAATTTSSASAAVFNQLLASTEPSRRTNAPPSIGSSLSDLLRPTSAADKSAGNNATPSISLSSLLELGDSRKCVGLNSAAGKLSASTSAVGCASPIDSHLLMDSRELFSEENSSTGTVNISGQSSLAQLLSSRSKSSAATASTSHSSMSSGAGTSSSAILNQLLEPVKVSGTSNSISAAGMGNLNHPEAGNSIRTGPDASMSRAATSNANTPAALSQLLNTPGGGEEETITLYRSQDTSVSQTFVAPASMTSTLLGGAASEAGGGAARSTTPSSAALVRPPQVPEVKQVVIPAVLQQQRQLSRLLSQRAGAASPQQTDSTSQDAAFNSLLAASTSRATSGGASATSSARHTFQQLLLDSSRPSANLSPSPVMQQTAGSAAPSSAHQDSFSMLLGAPPRSVHQQQRSQSTASQLSELLSGSPAAGQRIMQTTSTSSPAVQPSDALITPSAAASSSSRSSAPRTPASSQLSEILSRPLDTSTPRQVKTRELANLLTSPAGTSGRQQSTVAQRQPDVSSKSSSSSEMTSTDEGLVGRIADYLMRSSPTTSASSAGGRTTPQQLATTVAAPPPAVSNAVTTQPAAVTASVRTVATAPTAGTAQPVMQTGQVLVLNNQQKVLPQNILLHGQQYTLVTRDSQMIYLPTRLMQAQQQALLKQRQASAAASSTAAAVTGARSGTVQTATQYSASPAPPSATAATPPAAPSVSSTTLEQLREFESVLEAVSTRGQQATSSTAADPSTGELDKLVNSGLLGMTPDSSPAPATAASSGVSSGSVSVGTGNQFVFPPTSSTEMLSAAVDEDSSSRGSTTSSAAPVSATAKYAVIGQPPTAVSAQQPAAAVASTSAGAGARNVKSKVQTSTATAPHQLLHTKLKTGSVAPPKAKPLMPPTLVKASPVKQELEDDETRQRIAAILQQYQQDLACNPTPTPAPRNRKNAPVYTSRGGGTATATCSTASATSGTADAVVSKSKKKSPTKKLETSSSVSSSASTAGGNEDDSASKSGESPAMSGDAGSPATGDEATAAPDGGPLLSDSATPQPQSLPVVAAPAQQPQQYRTLRVLRLVAPASGHQHLLHSLTTAAAAAVGGSGSRVGSHQLIGQPPAALDSLLPPFHTLASSAGGTTPSAPQQPSVALPPPAPSTPPSRWHGHVKQEPLEEQLFPGLVKEEPVDDLSSGPLDNGDKMEASLNSHQSEHSNEDVHIPQASFFTEQLQSCLSTGEQLSPQQLQRASPSDSEDQLHLLSGVGMCGDSMASCGSEGSGPPTPLLSQSSVHVITGVLSGSSSGGAAGPGSSGQYATSAGSTAETVDDPLIYSVHVDARPDLSEQELCKGSVYAPSRGNAHALLQPVSTSVWDRPRFPSGVDLDYLLTDAPWPKLSAGECSKHRLWSRQSRRKTRRVGSVVGRRQRRVVTGPGGSPPRRSPSSQQLLLPNRKRKASNEDSGLEAELMENRLVPVVSPKKDVGHGGADSDECSLANIRDRLLRKKRKPAAKFSKAARVKHQVDASANVSSKRKLEINKAKKGKSKKNRLDIVRGRHYSSSDQELTARGERSGCAWKSAPRPRDRRRVSAAEEEIRIGQKVSVTGPLRVYTCQGSTDEVESSDTGLALSPAAVVTASSDQTGHQSPEHRTASSRAGSLVSPSPNSVEPRSFASDLDEGAGRDPSTDASTSWINAEVEPSGDLTPAVGVCGGVMVSSGGDTDGVSSSPPDVSVVESGHQTCAVRDQMETGVGSVDAPIEDTTEWPSNPAPFDVVDQMYPAKGEVIPKANVSPDDNAVDGLISPPDTPLNPMIIPNDQVSTVKDVFVETSASSGDVTVDDPIGLPAHPTNLTSSVDYELAPRAVDFEMTAIVAPDDTADDHISPADTSSANNAHRASVGEEVRRETDVYLKEATYDGPAKPIPSAVCDNSCLALKNVEGETGVTSDDGAVSVSLDPPETYEDRISASHNEVSSTVEAVDAGSSILLDRPASPISTAVSDPVSPQGTNNETEQKTREPVRPSMSDTQNVTESVNGEVSEVSAAKPDELNNAADISICVSVQPQPEIAKMSLGSADQDSGDMKPTVVDDIPATCPPEEAENQVEASEEYGQMSLRTKRSPRNNASTRALQARLKLETKDGQITKKKPLGRRKTGKKKSADVEVTSTSHDTVLPETERLCGTPSLVKETVDESRLGNCVARVVEIVGPPVVRNGENLREKVSVTIEPILAADCREPGDGRVDVTQLSFDHIVTFAVDDDARRRQQRKRTSDDRTRRSKRCRAGRPGRSESPERRQLEEAMSDRTAPSAERAETVGLGESLIVGGDVGQPVCGTRVAASPERPAVVVSPAKSPPRSPAVSPGRSPVKVSEPVLVISLSRLPVLQSVATAPADDVSGQEPPTSLESSCRLEEPVEKSPAVPVETVSPSEEAADQSVAANEIKGVKRKSCEPQSLMKKRSLRSNRSCSSSDSAESVECSPVGESVGSSAGECSSECVEPSSSVGAQSSCAVLRLEDYGAASSHVRDAGLLRIPRRRSIRQLASALTGPAAVAPVEWVALQMSAGATNESGATETAESTTAETAQSPSDKVVSKPLPQQQKRVNRRYKLLGPTAGGRNTRSARRQLRGVTQLHPPRCLCCCPVQRASQQQQRASQQRQRGVAIPSSPQQRRHMVAVALRRLRARCRPR